MTEVCDSLASYLRVLNHPIEIRGANWFVPHTQLTQEALVEAGIEIAEIWSDFKHFVHNAPEEPASSASLHVCVVRQPASHRLLDSSYGLQLQHFLNMLLRQPKGQAGDFLTNGRANAVPILLKGRIEGLAMARWNNPHLSGQHTLPVHGWKIGFQYLTGDGLLEAGMRIALPREP